MRIYLLLFYTFVDSILAREIPSYVHLCGRHDPEISKCMVKTIMELLPYLEKKGIPEMDLAPIDPLFIPEVTANTGTTTTAELEIKLSNITMFGLGKGGVKSFNADVDNARFSAVIYVPQLWLEGNYEINGKVLLLVVDSKGVIQINCTYVTANVEWYGKFYAKENEEYMRFEKIGVDAKIETMKLNFDNGMEGSSALIEAVNKAINENMDTFAADLAPIANDAIGKLGINYFNRPFSIFPVKELFPE